jgi:hypothetical protein
MDQVNQKPSTNGLGFHLKNVFSRASQVSAPEAAQAENELSTAKQDTQENPTLARLKVRAEQSFRKVELQTLKVEIAQDKNYVQQTLKNKLSEYGINPNTPVSLSKDFTGNLILKGQALNSQLDKINQDLNKDVNLKASFNRLSKQEPTLSYIDNVVKLSKAYGANNNLFNSLISEREEFNQLKDISLRYESMKSKNAGLSASEAPPFEIRLG